MTHEKMMEKAWRLIEELNITENQHEYDENPEELYLVENIYHVRDAFYEDLEKNIQVVEEDLPAFFDRHKIKWA